MKIRTTVEADLDTIHTLIAEQSLNTVTRERFDEYLASGAYRYDWSWVAEQDGRVVGLSIWWGMEQFDHPFSIDGLYCVPGADRVAVWTELIRHTLTSFPADAEPPSTTSSCPTAGVIARTSLRSWRRGSRLLPRRGPVQRTERLRYEWLPEYGLPVRSSRLR